MKDFTQDLPEADLLRQIEEHCRVNGIAEYKFGEEACGDSALVHTLRGGRELRQKTRKKILLAIGALADAK